jgi:hypothetical protein
MSISPFLMALKKTYEPYNSKGSLTFHNAAKRSSVRIPKIGAA